MIYFGPGSYELQLEEAIRRSLVDVPEEAAHNVDQDGIGEIKEHTIKAEDNRDPIDFEPLNTPGREPVLIEKCKHVFSKEGLMEWLKTHATCPLDRGAVTLAGIKRIKKLIVQEEPSQEEPLTDVKEKPKKPTTVAKSEKQKDLKKKLKKEKEALKQARRTATVAVEKLGKIEKSKKKEREKLKKKIKQIQKEKDTHKKQIKLLKDALKV